jgi:hypothetical protein
VRDTGLFENFTLFDETTPGIERFDVFLGMQIQRLVATELEGSLHQHRRYALASGISAHHHAPHAVGDTTMVERWGLIVHDAQITHHAGIIPNPQVNCGGVSIGPVEFFFGDFLFQKKHFASQNGHLKNLVRCEFTPRFDDYLALIHTSEFNGVIPETSVRV